MKLYIADLDKEFGLRSEIISRFKTLGFAHYKKTEMVPDAKDKKPPYHLNTLVSKRLCDAFITTQDISQLDLSNLPVLKVDDEMATRIFKEIDSKDLARIKSELQ